MEVNGIAHTFLTTGNFAKSVAFYRRLLPALGMQPVLDGEDLFYCVGGRTALGIRASHRQSQDNRFDQSASGLHHLCFRMRAREDVDTLYALLLEWQAEIIHAPQEDGWAPGYYSVLFADPDGIRLEANFVPGKGLLD